MESLALFRKVAADPWEYGRSFSRTNQLIGFPCSYGPEELILAAGFHPFRLPAGGKSRNLADQHLQSYCCSFVRGLLEEGLEGKTNFLAGIIFPHTCDSLQRLSDIWRIKRLSARHLDLVLPVKLVGGSSEVYFRDVLRRLRDQLGNWAGKTISDDELAQAIGLMNDIRLCLRKLFFLTSQQPGLLLPQDRGAILTASLVLARPQLRESLSQLLGELENSGGKEKVSSGKRLVLAGGGCDLPDIYDLVAQAGGEIIADDLCGGERAWAGLVATGGEPIAALAAHYGQRPACPSKHQGLMTRAKRLAGLVQERQADGVILLLLKFCDPQAFDFPYLREFLLSRGIPTLILEREDSRAASHQMTTRLEAFIETL